MKVKVKVQTEDRYGYSTKIIERVPKAVVFGNFQMLIIRYQNFEYLIGDGSEYMHGMPEEFELGKRLNYVGP
jgi:hypothetical protein